MRDPHRPGGTGIRNLVDRRAFLGACASLLLWPLVGRSQETGAEGRGAGASPGAKPRGSRAGDENGLPTAALETSSFVYISPLRSDGSESRCHGEVWFAWLDGAVVINTAPTTWKARALGRGLDRARIWVGNHGRWKGLLGANRAFRQAPHFDARVESVRDDALIERLLATYERKYPDEIGAWKEKMREGYRDGSRLLLRYVPL